MKKKNKKIKRFVFPKGKYFLQLGKIGKKIGKNWENFFQVGKVGWDWGNIFPIFPRFFSRFSLFSHNLSQLFPQGKNVFQFFPNFSPSEKSGDSPGIFWAPLTPSFWQPDQKKTRRRYFSHLKKIFPVFPDFFPNFSHLEKIFSLWQNSN